MDEFVMGLDVAKYTLDAILLVNGRPEYLQVANQPEGFNQLQAWVESHGYRCGRVCLEATGQYGYAAAKYLYEYGYSVSVINPARIKAYAASRLQRNKTDKVDAKLIAEFCQREKPPLWKPPRPDQAHLKALVHYLYDLKSLRQQEKNRTEFGKDVDLVADLLNEHIAFLDEKIKLVCKAIHNLIQQDPQLKHDCRLLASIPGVGKLTAARLLAEIPDFRAFKTSRQLTAYAGLNPRQYQSGSSIHRKSRISKTGNANLRYALFMPALVAYCHNPVVKDFCRRLLNSGKPKMVVMCAAMRKLLVLAFGVIKSNSVFDPNYAKLEVVLA
jgi:transposase